MDQIEEQYMTVKDAREVLGVSKVKMAELLRYGVLPWEPDPTDARTKLIPVRAIQSYQAQQAHKRKQRLTDPKALRVA